MRHFCLAVFIVSSVTQFCRGESKPLTAEQIIDRALVAHYGKANIEQPKAIQLDIKGQIKKPVDFEVFGTVFLMLPSKYRYEIDVQLNQNTISLVKVFDGKKIWIRANNKTNELNRKNGVQESKTSMYAEYVSTLISLRDKRFRLSHLGELKVKDVPTLGVRVSSKGQGDVGLYFDKESLLLRKVDFYNVDPANGKEVNVEKYYSGYKKVNSIMAPSHLIVRTDGSLYADYRISNFEFVERIDGSLFKRPE